MDNNQESQPRITTENHNQESQPRTVTMSVTTLIRAFKFNGRLLSDPSKLLSPSEVLDHYKRQYPRLNGAKILPPIIEGDNQVFEFKSQEFGAKG